METEHALYVSVGVLSAAWLLLLLFTVHVWCQHRRLRKHFEEMAAVGKFRVQKVKMRADENHAYQNPGIAPGEELSRRGYSMYNGEPDIEADQSQAAGPVFIEDLIPRNQRQVPPSYVDEVGQRNSRQPPSTAPPFLLNAIESNKRKSLSNPVASQQPRQTSVRNTNPNFIY